MRAGYIIKTKYVDWRFRMPIYHFQPDHYFSSFGSHPPVLHIADGDSVVTTTVDASGVDFRGQSVASGSNPETGPFYVDSAEPGDTLQVHLDRLTPNRELGFSYNVLAPNVVDPYYVHALPLYERVEWRINLGDNTATLVTLAAGMRPLTLPIAPMLGCLGVAPGDGQAISSSTSGPYGGNMDYPGFVSGVTAYFPVFVPGALLYMGDGHAIQGDGEVVGTGLEISYEVQFTVHLLKGKRTHWPRGENATHIFTVGNARPLDQALQNATTEMSIWLQEDYGLNAYSVGTLLGMCVEYDLGNIFDPAYTMVCKLAKRLFV
jgi:amidase